MPEPFESEETTKPISGPCTNTNTNYNFKDYVEILPFFFKHNDVQLSKEHQD